MDNPTKNEIELSYRIDRIENIIYTEDNIETAKALSKGAVSGTVNLMAELIDLKNDLDTLKQKINEIIRWLNYYG